MLMQSFEVLKDTVKFFYEIDCYWKAHKADKKNKTIKKLKSLYKGLGGKLWQPMAEAFLYRRVTGLLSWKLVKTYVTEAEYVTQVLEKSNFYRSYYNSMCQFCKRNFKKEDMTAIHEEFNIITPPLLEDTYQKCLRV